MSNDNVNVNVFLSRKQHDAMMDRDPNLLKQLFTKYVRNWSLGGVTFYNVPADVRLEVHLACGDLS